MGFFNYIETFFFISLGITFLLILLLVYHFKQRLTNLEEKNDTMFDIMNNIVNEITSIKNQFFKKQLAEMPSYNINQNVVLPNMSINEPVLNSPHTVVYLNTKIPEAEDEEDEDEDDEDDDEDDDDENEDEEEDEDEDDEDDDEDEDQYDGEDIDDTVQNDELQKSQIFVNDLNNRMNSLEQPSLKINELSKCEYEGCDISMELNTMSIHNRSDLELNSKCNVEVVVVANQMENIVVDTEEVVDMVADVGSEELVVVDIVVEVGSEEQVVVEMEEVVDMIKVVEVSELVEEILVKTTDVEPTVVLVVETPNAEVSIEVDNDNHDVYKKMNPTQLRSLIASKNPTLDTLKMKKNELIKIIMNSD